VSLCWFSTQFLFLLLTFYRLFICRYLPFGKFFFCSISLSICVCLQALLSQNFRDPYVRTRSWLYH
jgi:hypothetical protein